MYGAQPPHVKNSPAHGPGNGVNHLAHIFQSAAQCVFGAALLLAAVHGKPGAAAHHKAHTHAKVKIAFSHIAHCLHSFHTVSLLCAQNALRLTAKMWYNILLS